MIARHETLSWPVALAYLALYILFDWLSYIHPVEPLAITPWNPPPALSLVLLLRFGPRFWPLPFVAAFVAQAVVRGMPPAPGHAVLASLWLALGYAGLAELLRHRRLGPAFATLRDVFAFLLAVPPVTLLIGIVYVAIYIHAGLVPPGQFVGVATRFWIGDMIGVVVVAPVLMLAWAHLSGRILPGVTPEMLLQAGAILAILWLIFGPADSNELKYFYLLFLPLVWIALRHGIAGAAIASLAIQLGLIGALLWRGHQTATVLDYQFLMLALAATGLLLGMAISERRRALAALAERETALGQALRAAAVGEMTSALAHELNQPLMAISGYARASQLLARELQGSERLSDTLDSLVDKVSHAGDVVHRLREYYRYGSMRRETLEIRPWLDDVLVPLRSRAARNRIQLEVRVEPRAVRVLADPVQLGIVLHNLVSNAIDALANPESGVRNIALHVTRPDRVTVRFCVEDSGPGVAPEFRATLFSPLLSQKPAGMGLGLSICHSLIEGHGGRIWHEPGPEGGARFCFEVPAQEDESGSNRQHR